MPMICFCPAAPGNMNIGAVIQSDSDFSLIKHKSSSLCCRISCGISAATFLHTRVRHWQRSAAPSGQSNTSWQANNHIELVWTTRLSKSNMRRMCKISAGGLQSQASSQEWWAPCVMFAWENVFCSSPFSSHACIVQIRAANLPTTCFKNCSRLQTRHRPNKSVFYKTIGKFDNCQQDRNYQKYPKVTKFSLAGFQVFPLVEWTQLYNSKLTKSYQVWETHRLSSSIKVARPGQQVYLCMGNGGLWQG